MSLNKVNNNSSLIHPDLQGRLADYNTAIRVANGEASKLSVEEQTKELEVNNKRLQEEVEQIFMEKQRKENQLRQLREQMEKVLENSNLTVDYHNKASELNCYCRNKLLYHIYYQK